MSEPVTATVTACVEIGGIPIGLTTSDERFLALLRERYAGFLSRSRPEFELSFEVTSEMADSAGAPPDAKPDPAAEDVRVGRDGHDWLIRRGDFHARWNPASGRGRVRQNSNPYSLDSVVRILHSLILAERGGFLLHAASAICDGRAYLFSGVSGAGKTTISRLAPPEATLLTDEISYLRPGDHGYNAYGTPFTGELAQAGENRSAPVAALFFLEKGAENRIDEMGFSSAERVRRLMRNILFFAEDRVLVEKLLATACDFVAQVPVRQLTFYPDARVWDAVRAFSPDAEADAEADTEAGMDADIEGVRQHA